MKFRRATTFFFFLWGRFLFLFKPSFYFTTVNNVKLQYISIFSPWYFKLFERKKGITSFMLCWGDDTLLEEVFFMKRRSFVPLFSPSPRRVKYGRTEGLKMGWIKKRVNKSNEKFFRRKMNKHTLHSFSVNGLMLNFDFEKCPEKFANTFLLLAYTLQYLPC